MNQGKTNIAIAITLIIFAAVMKVVTYPHSVNPIIAIALFSGAMISNKKLSFVMPLLAMFASDLMLELFNIAPGFYGISQVGNYAALLFVTVLGFNIKKIDILSVAGFSIGASLLFFLLSNTNTFLFDSFHTYSRSFTGWIDCLVAGLPFLRDRIAVDLTFSALLFGGYVLLFNPHTKRIIA